MGNVDRYREEFEALMAETEAKSKRAGLLRGVERFEQLLAKAAEAGIDHQQVWTIIASPDDDQDPKAGLRALIAAIEERTSRH